MVPQSTSVLGNAEQVKSLTPFQGRLGIDLLLCYRRGTVHEEFGGPDAGAVSGA